VLLAHLCLFSIDASQEPVSGPKLGRLVNHGDKAKHRNATMKIVDETAMALYATRSITAGEQILYDYGVQVPWTGQVYYYPSFYLTIKTLFHCSSLPLMPWLLWSPYGIGQTIIFSCCSLLVHSQVTTIFVVSVGLFVCLFVCAEFFSAVFDPISIKL